MLTTCRNTLLWGVLLTLSAATSLAQTSPPTISNPQVIMTSSSNAWVVFTTDRPAKATVEYHSVNGASRTISESEFETEHAILLSGLIQGLRYEGTITAVAEDGATAMEPLPPFTAMEPQVDVAFESRPQIFFIGPDEAVVALSTNTPSTVEVHFGRSAELMETVRDDTPSKTHVLTLSNLLPNATYTFLVTVRGPDGSIETTAPATFRVEAFEPNLTLTRPDIFQTGEGSAFVVFTTSRPAKATVEITSGTGVMMTISETEFETRHAVLIPNLIVGQTYSGRVTVRGEEGDVAIEFIDPFTVTDEAREIGFEIPPQVLVIGPDEAIVTFTTTTATTARVNFGLNGMLDRQVQDTSPMKTHALILPGLQPGAVYTYIVTVQEPDGAIVSTAPKTFIVTPADGGVLLGDVDLDGFIDVRDVVLALRYIVDILPLTLEQIEAADVNRDGVVNVRDAVRILQIIVGLEEQ